MNKLISFGSFSIQKMRRAQSDFFGLIAQPIKFLSQKAFC